ncbi:MAG TPA: molybdopterin cofactor-binding domain-containing protein, partial [Candidatus Limnocylindria bacterium]|nr:molybdopterin cofactor-binding domain-containing protein [Candidatus Limnocylindria bacterium]
MERQPARATTRTAPPPTRSVPLTRPVEAPLIAPPGEPTPGRARPALPLRREGPAKLTGEAKYADDLVFPDAWYGATIRSGDPHARLLAIELGDGFDWRRVALVTADDIPGENVVSLIDDDQPVLVPLGGEIRHHAEPVCLLAAADRETLHEAKRHVSLRTEPIPPVFDPLASEQVFAHFEIARGDVESALASADLVVEGEYRVGHQEQLYIENQAMIAVPREDGGLTVHGSCQCPYYIHKAMKRALDLDDRRCVVVPPGGQAPGRATTTLPLRREGPEKLTGVAKYADDLVFPGAWYGATVRSTEPLARLLAIELDPGFDWSRVAVVTARDIPGENVVSLIDDDQPVLVPLGGEIRHQAEPVCLLAAADRETLHEAKRHVSLRTEPIPPVFDPLASEQVFAHFEIARGDVESALASADLVVEGEYRVGHQEQLYIENQAMIAVPREDGGVTVHGSCQCPYYIHKAMKRALDLDDERCVVVQTETGGGF